MNRSRILIQNAVSSDVSRHLPRWGPKGPGGGSLPRVSDGLEAEAAVERGVSLQMKG